MVIESACSNSSGLCNSSLVPDEDESDFDVSYLIDFTWTILYSLMLFVAIAGNAIVMWIVTGMKLNEDHCMSYLSDIFPHVCRTRT